MSFKVIAWAMQTPLPSREKWILVALADHADDGGRCWPSMETLAKKTGHGSRNTVRAAVAQLETLGYLSKKGRVVGAGIQTSHMYHLNVGHLHRPLEDESPAGQDLTSTGQEVTTGHQESAGPAAGQNLTTHSPAGQNLTGVGHQVTTNLSMNLSSSTTEEVTRTRENEDLAALEAQMQDEISSVRPTADDFRARMAMRRAS